MYFSPNSAGEQPGIRQAYIALHARRVSAPNSPALSATSITDPAAARIALQRVQSDPRDLRAARAYATVLSSLRSNPILRLEGLLALATLDATDGREASVLAWWQEADAIDSVATNMHRALLVLASSADADSSRIIMLRNALAAPLRMGINSDESLSDSERDALRQYVIGMLSLRLRDVAAVEKARRALARAPRASRVATALEAALRGQQAFAVREYEKAARAFAESVASVPIGLRRQYPLLEQHADRLAHADALRALGRWEEATRWYRSLLDGPAITAVPYAAAARAGLDAVAVQSAREQAQ
jgi:tetratricopeptide (TPR) repeat protein